MTLFIGDLHLGKRLPHSTLESNQRFWNYTLNKLEQILEESASQRPVVQLGDLFDKPKVGHLTLTQGYLIAKEFDVILQGNHDFNADLTKDTALSCLPKIDSGLEKNLMDSPTKRNPLTLVGHQPTQELFEQDLKSLEENKVLCLHANSPNHPEPGLTENTITPEMLAELKDKFEHIICGHEHNFSQMGNLTMLGSFMPFSFGDMSDKKIATWNPNSGLDFVTTWSKAEKYLECSHEEFIELPLDHAYQFIEVKGEVTSSEWSSITSHINHLFIGSDVFAIKDSTSIQGVVNSSQEDYSESSVLSWEEDAYNRIKEEINQEAADSFKRISDETK